MKSENVLKGLTFKFIYLGCKVNYYEVEALSHLLSTLGMFEIKGDEESDISIVNTCAVTEEAARKSKQMIRRAIKENNSKVNVVMGCLSQIEADTISKIEGVSIILGSNNKKILPDVIEEYLKENKQLNYVQKEVFKSKYDDLTLPRFSSHTRAFLKVQDGCTNFCTYCVIPYTRGNLRSKPVDMAVKEVKELVSNGHKEVVISGIHTGAYGKDLGITLYDLLVELNKIEGLLRIRISSIEINQVTDEIINLIKTSPKMVPHLHIPLQAGSERILKLMNRHYSMEEFLERINYIRNEIPGISITTDYITGFPTETDEDFNESLKNLDIINFQMIHTFPYSLRKGTKAALMEQVDPKVKKDRCHKVLEISKRNYSNYVESYIGKEVDVIFETYDNGFIYGHSGNYIYCKAEADISYLNKLTKVKLLNNDKDAALVSIIK